MPGVTSNACSKVTLRNAEGANVLSTSATIWALTNARITFCNEDDEVDWEKAEGIKEKASMGQNILMSTFAGRECSVQHAPSYTISN
jgi:hypothetical protein